MNDVNKKIDFCFSRKKSTVCWRTLLSKGNIVLELLACTCSTKICSLFKRDLSKLRVVCPQKAAPSTSFSSPPSEHLVKRKLCKAISVSIHFSFTSQAFRLMAEILLHIKPFFEFLLRAKTFSFCLIYL